MVFASGAQAQDFEFDPSEFEKPAFQLDGYLEGNAEYFRYDRTAAFYGLSAAERDIGAGNGRAAGTAELRARYEKGRITASATIQGDGRWDADQENARDARLLEGAVAVRPATGFSLEAGKKVLKWGKGYGWNPVGFVERAKDPADPDLSREGFWMLTADYVRSFRGSLQTVGIMPVVLPVTRWMNEDFGEREHVNFGGKLYLLYDDTDIDFMLLASGTRPARFGADFSRNLRGNLEIHGEIAFTNGAERQVLDENGNAVILRDDALSVLLGLRYLSGRETTYIVEYHRNGSGFEPSEMRDFLEFAQGAAADFAASGDETSLRTARALSQAGYGRQTPAQDYLYVRASQKEPFDILYFTPSVTAIANLGDRSLFVMPELLYTGFTNFEVRLRGVLNAGGRATEFGEKLAGARRAAREIFLLISATAMARDRSAVQQAQSGDRIVRWGWYSIAVNAALIALHAIVAAVSGSLAVRAELIHNLVDAASAGAVLAGLKIATRKSGSFPYGLYKVENLVAAAIAVMVFLTAYEVVHGALLGAPHELTVDAWMLASLVVTLALPLAFSHFELRAARAAGSPALIADAREYRMHAYTTGLAFAALLSAWLDFPLDRLAALVIVAVVVKTGWELLHDALRVLLDASLDADTLGELRRIIAADPTVAEVKWLTGRNAGRFRFAEAGVALRVASLPLAEAAVRRIESTVRTAVPQIERLLLHIEARTSTCLRYAVPLADRAGTISEHFGEAPCFAFVTVDSGSGVIEEQTVRANPYRAEERAKGLRVAEWLASEKVDRILVAKDLEGKGPAYVFRDAAIEVARTEKRTLAELFPSRAE